MSKIICDICGTRYPETADQCPICGHVREASGKTAEDVLILEDTHTESHTKTRGGRFSKSNVKKRTEGTFVYEETPVAKPKAGKKAEIVQPVPDEEETFIEDRQSKKANTILNVLLVIVVLALLGVSAFIFTQYVLPEMNKPEATSAPTETEPEITEPVITEEPTYPCQELFLEETDVLLAEYEQKWLINVAVMPENTTDELTFSSSDELIATVDEEGCITALAEGQAVITITCGNVTAEYNVICLFPGVEINPGEVPTDPPPTEPPVEYVVTTNYVNVRTGPSTGYDKVRQCNKGDTIWVYKVKTYKGVEWGKLEDGWICLKYAKKVG